MPIRLLDQHTAELIAAGEVVERPSSVVKELCENAIDAGARNVTVEISGGGISLIRVQDDGAGIPSDEIPLAFLRHATSKVATQADLDAIHTLGFRGEALASIASVAKVELLTKTEADEYASLYSIAGGAEQGLQPAARPTGTTMTVQALFYNTPARMKFLKKDSSEGTFVSETVSRLALSHPEISFRFVRDGKQVFATPGDGKLQSAAYAVLGAEFTRPLLPVDGTALQYRVHGLITPPRSCRASRAMQYFFINGRFVKNRTVMAALEQAYRGLAMHGKFPGAVLFLEMPPELVDVNVHPAKTEVRFAREGDVFEAVYKAAKSALLGNFANHDELSLSMPGAASGQPVETTRQTPVAGAETKAPVPYTENKTPGKEEIRAYNALTETLASTATAVPYETASRPGPYHTARPFATGEAALDIEPEEATPVLRKEGPAAQQEAAVPAATQTTFETPSRPDELRLVGEVFKTYIVAQAGDTLCLIDKHAAHERILYEQLAENRQAADVQQLLSPVNVNLGAAEKNALLQNGQALAAAGIEIEDFGGGSVLVRGVPADVEMPDVENLVVEVAQRLAQNSNDTMNEKTEWVLHSVACRAAVKAGDKTPPAQLLALAGQILAGVIPPFCPHGRPVVLELTRKELERQFGRLG